MAKAILILFIIPMYTRAREFAAFTRFSKAAPPGCPCEPRRSATSSSARELTTYQRTQRYAAKPAQNLF